MSMDMRNEMYQITKALSGIEYQLGAMPAMPMNDSLTEVASLVRRLAHAVETVSDREVALRDKVAELEGAVSLLGNLLDERLRVVEERSGLL